MPASKGEAAGGLCCCVLFCSPSSPLPRASRPSPTSPVQSPLGELQGPRALPPVQGHRVLRMQDSLLMLLLLGVSVPNVQEQFS